MKKRKKKKRVEVSVFLRSRFLYMETQSLVVGHTHAESPYTDPDTSLNEFLLTVGTFLQVNFKKQTNINARIYCRLSGAMLSAPPGCCCVSPHSSTEKHRSSTKLHTAECHKVPGEMSHFSRTVLMKQVDKLVRVLTTSSTPRQVKHPPYLRGVTSVSSEATVREKFFKK